MAAQRTQVERVAAEIVDSCICVHREVGAGLMESVYQACLAHELRGRGVEVACEVALPVLYKGTDLNLGYRIDMLVGGELIIENKCVQSILPIHEAQLLTYLRLSDRRVGFLINWNVTLIRDGIRRMVLGL